MRFGPKRGAELAAGGAVLLMSLLAAACGAATPARQPRAFIPPPAQVRQPPEPLRVPDAPSITVYPEIAYVPVRMVPPRVAPTSDGEFVIAQAERHFAAGKRALQEGRTGDARVDFDLAIEALLTAPHITDPLDRERIRMRLESMSDAIYHYDLGPLGAAVSEEAAAEEQSSLASILEMTFPVDPSLRGRVREQIQATVSELPLEENDYVLSYINYFRTTRGQKVLLSGFARSGRYREMIERILDEEGLPEELVFVAQQESRYDPRAVSVTRNTGLWQFGASRGKEYGLVQTSLVDYRRDPEKSTRAAARHLRDLYDHYGDWYLALAAYNCGPGCVDRAIFRTGYADFWELRRLRALPLQTANYVPVILAITIMYKNMDAFGLGAVRFDPAVEYDSIELPSPTHLALVADAVDQPLSELKDLNPALLRLEAPQGYALRVPKGTLADLEAAFAVIPLDKRKSWRIHRVDAGDTLASVAKKYGTTAALVSSANHGALPEAGAFAAIPVAYPNGTSKSKKRVASAGSLAAGL
jgi:membrane-bound lytic murein transglycosylase D